VYCRGGFLPEEEASVGLFDRGFLFGDAVYEVTAVVNGKMIDNDLHLARLERSLGELDIPMPMTRAEIEAMQLRLIRENALQEGTIYMQVSRGEEDREFLYSDNLAPVLVAFTQVKTLVETKAQRDGIKVDLAQDPRWQRRDIKTVMLLAQVLAKREAKARGFNDVWLVEDDKITEGASSTAYIVTADKRIITRGNSNAILPGCTRQALLTLCDAHGYSIEERAFSPAEAQAATEAFATSASSLVMPVVQIGDALIGQGTPGPLTRKLQALYLAAAGIVAQPSI